MTRIALIVCACVFILTAEACRSNGGSGSPGISRPSKSSGMGSGPSIYHAKRGGGGHTPSISGPRNKRDSMAGPTRQHGRR